MKPFKLVFYNSSDTNIVDGNKVKALDYIKGITPGGHKQFWKRLGLGGMTLETYMAMSGSDLAFSKWLGSDNVLAMIRLSDSDHRIRHIVDITDTQVLEFYDVYLANSRHMSVQEVYDMDKQMSELMGLTLEEHRIPGFYT